ncbi:MAG: hypothetical protein QOC93_314 [Actinomycetota bacterium]|nr:hypothetical protein [Actinomycetota bacterium]
MRSLARRLGAVATTTALVTGGALHASPAQAAPTSYGYSAARWLSDQLTDGLVHSDQFGGYDDYGLSLDIFHALTALGTRPGSAAAVIDALAANPQAYIGVEDGTSHETYAGATGKLATAAELAGRDATAFGGVDLVDRLEGLVVTGTGPETGRAVDASAYGDYSNTIGQSWDVRALTGAGSALADEAMGFLLRQQCADGFFRLTFEKSGTAGTPFTCDGAAAGKASPSIDATAFAVQALDAARDRGVAGLDDDIADAADWLTRTQAADGSFADMEVANTNSTGLAAAALTAVGRTGTAGNAAAWLLQHQVTDAVAESSALTTELGAIAFDAGALAAGKRDGITPELADQWRRATAQAAVGVDAVLGATTVGLTAPSGYREGGAPLTLSVGGLAPGERYTLTVPGLTPSNGVASGTGAAAATVRLPEATRSYDVVVTGSRGVRTGRTTVTALGATTFRQTVRNRPIRAGRTQRVTLTGLAAGERVTLTYRGTRIWSGTASASGTVVHDFAAGRSLGTKTLSARGAFADRSSSGTFRVVR